VNEHQAWVQARRLLSPEAEFRAWSRGKGYTDTTFKISESNASSIVVSSPTMSKPRVISKADFIKVAAAWDDYCKGNIGRAEMAQLSQNTTYIFGILKRLEDDQ
jgi:hypothetical protein